MIELALLQGTAFYRKRVEFDGSTFLLDLAWNARAGSWYLSLFDAAETPLVVGITVVPNRPLLKRFRATPGMPAGDLVAFDLTETITKPGYDELGPVVSLVYVEASEIA
jgi:hypothetical protein